MIAYHLVYMAESDKKACQAARDTGYVVTNENKHPGASSKPLPKYLIHGTDLPAALNILKEGRFLAGTGICGDGVHGFALESLEPDAVKAAFERDKRGGYVKGAAFILETDGILIKGAASMTVPVGAISFKTNKGVDDTQFSARPRSITPAMVLMSMDALVAELGDHLLDYSVQLHTALMGLQTSLLGNKAVTKQRLVKLSNSFVRTMPPTSAASASSSKPPTTSVASASSSKPPTTSVASASSTAAPIDWDTVLNWSSWAGSSWGLHAWASGGDLAWD